MPLPDQTPSEEFTERVGETASGTIVVPHLIATKDYAINQHRARKAVQDHRQIMRKLLMDGAGMTEDDMPESSNDDMGDIIYTGDIVVRPGTDLHLGNSRIKVEPAPLTPAEPVVETPPATTPPAPVQPTTPTQPQRESTWNKLGPLLVAVALGGGLPIATWAVSQWWNKPPAVVPVTNDPLQDWKLGLEVHD